MLAAGDAGEAAALRGLASAGLLLPLLPQALAAVLLPPPSAKEGAGGGAAADQALRDAAANLLASAAKAAAACKGGGDSSSAAAAAAELVAALSSSPSWPAGALASLVRPALNINQTRFSPGRIQLERHGVNVAAFAFT